MESAKQFLQGMGHKARQDLYELPINLSYTEAQNYIKKFKAFDKDGDGHIRYVKAMFYFSCIKSTFISWQCISPFYYCSKKDLRKALEEIGEQVSEAQLRELIAEVDVNQNSTIEEEEFLIVSISYFKPIVNKFYNSWWAPWRVVPWLIIG